MKRTFIMLAGMFIFAAAAVASAYVIRARFHRPLLVASSLTMQPDETHLWHCGMHPQVIQDHPGTCPICHMDLTPLNSTSQPGAGGEKKILYWWDPMLGPASIADKPGLSAMGMQRVPVYVSDVSAGASVTIDPTVVQNMGVRTVIAARGPLAVTIRAVGMLKAPQSGLHDISLRVSGWIEKLNANIEGIHVHQGEILFEIYSPALQVASEELISAIRWRKGLDPAAAVAVVNDADRLVESTNQKLRLLGIADEDIASIAGAEHPLKSIPYRSPADGAIVELAVVQGSAVQSGMKLMRIEDHSHLWLDSEVYEGQVALVALGQKVQATLDSLPGETFSGEVSFITPHIDHMTRTVTVRTMLENPKAQLKPGMYASVRIISRPIADAVLVPREAIIDTGRRKIAFIAEREGHFSPRKVTTGIVGDDGQVQILEGLAAGELVVTSGQFLMDVESRTTEAIDKLRHITATSKPATMLGGRESGGEPRP